MTEAPQTVTIGEKQYEIAKLSIEVRELLSLHAQAQDMMLNARRQAAIHELALVNIANIIKGRVEADDKNAEQPVAPLAGHVVQ
jgi:hypothetical protein